MYTAALGTSSCSVVFIIVAIAGYMLYNQYVDQLAVLAEEDPTFAEELEKTDVTGTGYQAMLYGGVVTALLCCMSTCILAITATSKPV